MDESLGLQGTKRNFLGLVVGEEGMKVIRAKVRCESYNDLISQDTSILCTSKVNLQKKSITVLEIKAGIGSDEPLQVQHPLTLCPNKFL